ncbi:MAG: hypothetical protein QUS08_09270 [Methanothrix sp.]|nr:hypothetical protein [Methanothrix sp.]
MRVYSCSVLLASALMMVLLFSCQAITNEDLLSAGNGYRSEPDQYVGTGATNQAPSAKSLTPDRDGPQAAGSTIVWTGSAYDPEGDRLLYQFWLNGPLTGNTWKPMTMWSENNTWNWTTSMIDSGVNIIDMRVRDGRHAAPWGYDSHISAEYHIYASAGGVSRTNAIPSLISIRSDRQSPQEKGARVTWTAKASDPDGDTILYQYLLKGRSTEEQWQTMTPWTTNNIWVWDTGQVRAGIYMIEVRIRDGYHAGIEGSDDSEMTPYVVMQKGIIE